MKFSIIIPTFNSERYLKSCLDSIVNITYPKNKYEVLVVDGGSKDKTLDIIKSCKKIRLLHSKNLSISNSRNIAARQAKGDILVFIDSDCKVNKELLSISEKHLKDYTCCGSFYKPEGDSGFIAKTWLLIEKKEKGIVDWVPSGTLAVKKEAYDEINGFNEHLKTGEDFDFCHRLRKKNHKIYNDPRIASIHMGQTDSLTDFIRKEIWRGNSLIKGIKKHGFLKEEFLSTALTLYHFFILLFSIIALFSINNLLISSSAAALVSPSFLLAARKTIKTRRPGYFFNFWMLIFIYQVSRAASIIINNQFKDVF